ncbi:hypothetical protein ACLB2K_006815 [Fragaria x ananassa]
MPRIGFTREVPSPQVPRESHESALGWGDSLLSVASRYLGESVRAWLGTVAKWQVSPRLVGDCCYVASQSALGWGLSRSGKSVRAWWGTVAMWRVSPRLVGDCREVASQSALDWDCCYVASQSALGWGLPRALRAVALASQSALDWGLSRSGKSVHAWLGTVAKWHCGSCVASQSALDLGDSLLSVAGRCLGEVLAILQVSDWEASHFTLDRVGASAWLFATSFIATTQIHCFTEVRGKSFVVGMARNKGWRDRSCELARGTALAAWWVAMGRIGLRRCLMGMKCSMLE